VTRGTRLKKPSSSQGFARKAHRARGARGAWGSWGIENRTFFSSLFQQATTQNKKKSIFYFILFYFSSIYAEELHPIELINLSVQGERGGMGEGEEQGDELVPTDAPMSAWTHGRVRADALVSAQTQGRIRADALALPRRRIFLPLARTVKSCPRVKTCPHVDVLEERDVRTLNFTVGRPFRHPYFINLHNFAKTRNHYLVSISSAPVLASVQVSSACRTWS
jgi:hypothetical protein